MIHTYKSASGKTTISVTGRNSDKVMYIILPAPLLEHELEDLANQNQCSIAVLSGLDWNDDLTPWPCPTVKEGVGPFGGESRPFNDYIIGDVIPTVENILGVRNPVRSLIGVSLSGLFAVWQWAQDDSFENIVSISGSFWYEGFVKWAEDTYSDKALDSRKTGKALFYLGVQEGKPGHKVFEEVGNATEKIVEKMKQGGINAKLTIVEGGHKSPVYPRLQEILKDL